LRKTPKTSAENIRIAASSDAGRNIARKNRLLFFTSYFIIIPVDLVIFIYRRNRLAAGGLCLRLSKKIGALYPEFESEGATS
jgi:hypothetical protein